MRVSVVQWTEGLFTSGVFFSLFLAVISSSDNSCPNFGKANEFLHLSSKTPVYNFAERQTKIELKSEGMMCESLSKPAFEAEPQKWQDVHRRQVKVFSAFYEPRESADGPAIRIIATGFQAAYNNVGEMYCHLWYENMDHCVVTGPALYHVIYPSTLHPDMWCSHFIICKLPTSIKFVPFAVSVTSRPCEKPANTLLVLNRYPVREKGDFAVCISPLYNHFENWTMIVENFELHKLLGAKRITIYQYSVSPMTAKTLRHYSSKDIVTVVQWPYPPLKSNVWCQRGALNDCLYRNKHKYKYVSITDLDELIIPRSCGSWPCLFDSISGPLYGAYLFQHAYFRRNYSNPTDPYLITQTSFYRTDKVTPAGKIRCKSIYDADKAISIDLHFPYSLVSGARELVVKPDDAMLHHYRKDPMETFLKYPERFRYIEDKYMTRYQDPLTRAVREKTQIIEK